MHRETNARVAIKIMDKSQIREEHFTINVRREIYIMRLLEHPHIVKLFEVLTSDSKLYIVMQLVTGGELFETIEHGPLPEHRARHFFQQLVDGVDFCHKKGVAHRDLKPENLLVDENGDLKITDFGFSSMRGMDVNNGLLFTQCGTPDYCAPEILDGSKNGYNGAKVDAWSCGVVLFALLAGRLPFLAKETEALYDLIIECKVDYSLIRSPDARHLLQNLLVRDYNKRYDLQKVKRHRWFLVDYDGDDVKLLKKRPFFNKNPTNLTSSTPSSPHSDASAAFRTPTHGTAMSNGDVRMGTSSPLASSSVLQSPQVPVAYGEAPDNMGYASSGMSHEAAMHMQQAVYPPDVTMRNSHLVGRPMLPVPRLREEQQQYGMYKPPSPVGDLDVHMRFATPPTHAVITRVEDRPATPARRQTSSSTAAAFKAAQAAAAAHANPSSALGHLTIPGSPGFQNSPARMSPARLSPARMSPMGNGPMPMMSGPEAISPNALYEPASSNNPVESPSPMDSTAQDDSDDSSSEQDSTEDYEDKGAFQLDLPLGQLHRLRSAQGRNQYMHQSLQHAAKRRHDSDLGVSSGTLLVSPVEGPASMSSVQLQRRGFSRDGLNSGTVNDPRLLRVAVSSEIPTSPPVVYSPSGVTGTSYDRYRSVSPGFNGRQGLGSDGSSPTGSHPSGISGFPTPWHSNGNGHTSRDDLGATNGGLQSEIIARHLWNMVCKLRGTEKPANFKLSQELRSDFTVMCAEMNNMSKKEDVAAVLTKFVSLFETLGLSDGPVSSPGFGRQQNRSRGTSDMEEDYEDGTTIESREELSANGDIRYGGNRRTGTDMSSEEEPQSWSPVFVDTATRHQSDLARRRNISDLLNRMIKKTNKVVPPEQGGRTASFTGDDGEPTSTTDLVELQRLMQEHHSGGREETNIADDLLRLMHNGSDDGNSMQFGSQISLPGQSQAHAQTSRTVDAYTQVRYQGNIPNPAAPMRPSTPHRNISGSNVPLPPEYVPGRFKEPQSMPARANSGSQRHNNRRGRSSEPEEVGDTVNSIRNREDMATSMGMHDVPYYGSDKKNMATKFRGVLQTMKAKNQKLGERHAQFRSSLPPEEILKMLAHILLDMGAKVSINKATRRKLKCSLPIQPNWVLQAGIEVTSVENDISCVSFKRSRYDRGRTDTDTFQTFFEQVRAKFIEDANSWVPESRPRPSRRGRKKTGTAAGRHISDSVAQLVMS